MGEPRREKYLRAIAGEDVDLPEVQSREDYWLKKIAEEGGGGGSGGDDVFVCTFTDTSGGNLACDKSFAEIRSAVLSGKAVYGIHKTELPGYGIESTYLLSVLRYTSNPVTIRFTTIAGFANGCSGEEIYCSHGVNGDEHIKSTWNFKVPPRAESYTYSGENLILTYGERVGSGTPEYYWTTTTNTLSLYYNALTISDSQLTQFNQIITMLKTQAKAATDKTASAFIPLGDLSTLIYQIQWQSNKNKVSRVIIGNRVGVVTDYYIDMDNSVYCATVRFGECDAVSNGVAENYEITLILQANGIVAKVLYNAAPVISA